MKLAGDMMSQISNHTFDETDIGGDKLKRLVNFYVANIFIEQFKSSLLQSTDHYGTASRQWELLLWKPQFTDRATSQLL